MKSVPPRGSEWVTMRISNEPHPPATEAVGKLGSEKLTKKSWAISDL